MLSKIKLWAIVIVVGALLASTGYFGYKYFTTEVKLEQNKVTTLTEKNDGLKTDIIKKDSSDAVTAEVKQEVKKEETAVTKAKTAAKISVEQKMKEITAKYEAMEKTAENEKRKQTEISLERARGLFLTFCLQEPEEKLCTDSGAAK